MQIRTKLTLQFFALVAVIILFCFSVIYVMLSRNRKSEFYHRMELKSATTAELLFDVAQIDSTLLRRIDKAGTEPFSFENVTVYNKSNQAIYRNNDSINFHITLDDLNQIRRNGRVQFEKGEYRILGILFKGQNDNFVIVAGDIDWASITKNSYLFKLLFILYCVSLIIVALTGRLFAQRSLAPLSKVIAQVHDLPIESLDTRLSVMNEKDEIGQLARTFNMLLDKIQNALKLQKKFLSAASHEMKNPLTSITSQLQVLQLKTRTPDEYKQALDSVLEDIGHLNKTTNDLIEFARLSYEINLGINFEPIRIDDVLWQCKEYYVKVNPLNTVRIEFKNLPSNPEDLVISANMALLRVAFLNVMDNACKFSDNNTVSIVLTIHKDRAELAFSDNGIGMTESEYEHIFEPFYRTNNTSGIVGHGLGLALVKRIVEFHHGTIQVVSTLNVGSTFSLSFPR